MTMTHPPLLATDQFGTGSPIVLLHPSGFGPRLLQPFALALATDHHVVVPHRRQYSGSAGIPAPRTLDDQHEDLLRLMDHLHLEQPAIVGVSGGATLALGFARRSPDRVATTIAHEPLVGPLAPTLHARVSARIAKLLAHADEPHETSLFMSELVGTATWNHLDPALRDAVETNGAAARHEASLFAGFALSRDDLGQLGSAAGGLVLTTVGERSGEMRHEAAAVLADHGVARHEVPAAGHLPVIEQTDRFAALVRSLLPTTVVVP
jgi:pimeloyl-ACP methyl ester carboxylesterase